MTFSGSNRQKLINNTWASEKNLFFNPELKTPKACWKRGK
jgi:hypothetical protein